MDELLKANRDHWNDLAGINAGSELYRLNAFKQGGVSLHDLERRELGDVAGKSLLHLQCHFGMDTLSWARLGATVTGVDFADSAIAQAQALSAELDIPARFICANLYDLPATLPGEQFDIVYTSYGALCWLPDIARWAEIAAGYLKPGGALYLAEFHPMVWVMEDDPATGFRMAYSYFPTAEPWRSDEQGAYADRNAHVAHPVRYEWQHPVGEVVSALCAAGLRIEFLHEHPYSVFNQLLCMEADEERRWRLPGGASWFPLMYSVKATKDRGG